MWCTCPVAMSIYLFYLLYSLKGSDLRDDELVIFGGGHAATLALRAVKKDLVKTSAIAAVAPTWAGPFPIVFGRDSNMEPRKLRAPAVGINLTSTQILRMEVA
ncbi:hypothetical protein BVC80_1787g121 [Macleaya cordata]|uniref:Uncharacterized protein n=1 Tax=Macleaya cordata TaxID=56857 RepID=A0A200QUA6_MACCD|nr:hypothetical protein BVC80_1787g121 [Macleaya cordata]